MYITRTLHKNILFEKVVYAVLNLFFRFERKLCQIFPIKDGSIVIIALHKLGDTVFTIPAIKEIQKYYSKEITIFCYNESIPIYKIALDNVIYVTAIQDDFYLSNRVASFGIRKKLLSLNPEVIVDLTGVMTSASLIFNSRAKIIIGMNRMHFKGIYDFFTPHIYKSHLAEMYMNVALLINPNIKIDSIYDHEFKSQKIKKILIHPLAGWKAKEWGIRKFIEIAEILINEIEVEFIITSDSLSGDIISEIKNKNINIIETKTIEELISALDSDSILIGNDSGPIHIASLLGKPTFTIYGPTNPLFHIPKGNHHDYTKIDLKCSPKLDDKMCFADGGRNGCYSFECMNQLSVEKVEQDIRLFINELNSRLDSNPSLR